MILIFSVWTVVVAVLFIGIAAWVYNGRNKARYEAAARIPLEEDDDGTESPTNNEDVSNG